MMLVGNAGCGKTQLITGLLNRVSSSLMSAVINFNFYTNADLLRGSLEQPLEKKAGTTFGPPGKNPLVYFLDDFNLSEVDVYNTQSAISLVRQHMDYGGWWDLNKLVQKKVINTQYLACMNHTAGSFGINPRLQRHFVTFAIDFPGATSLLQIYQTFLDGHLQAFDAGIQDLSANIISSALNLHQDVAKAFRKTAKNFHYEFNIRHMSNVFQGLLTSTPEQFAVPEKFVLLWLHESERVYGDRLVNMEDLNKFRQLALSRAKSKFGQYNFSKYFAGENSEALIFCNFADGVDDKVYNKVDNLPSLKETVQSQLDAYNEENEVMDLVLFDDALKHVCRIARIVSSPSGHALLVGVGGMGKQSLSKLSAYVCELEVKQIVISSTYTLNDFKTELAAMMMKAGCKETGIMFLFTDQQIFDEKCLVYMNDLLSSGNIPELFAQEDKDNINNAVASRVKALGDVTPKTCWDFFVSEVQKNLHCVLCFSPVGDGMRTRSMKFPGLVNCTVIDWFQPWPKDALRNVAIRAMKDVPNLTDSVRQGIEAFMPESFEIVNAAAKAFFKQERRIVHTTPKSYLELLALYTSLLSQKREESAAAIIRLRDGKTKLDATNESVAGLKEDLEVMLNEANIAKDKAAAIATTVGKEKVIVDAESAKAKVEQESVTKIATEADAIAADAQADLDNAEPLVREAMAALDSLNKKDLGNAKGMNVPPKGVDVIFAAVMTLLANVDPGVQVTKSGKPKDTSWKACKKQLMGDIPSFLKTLLNFKNVVDDFQVPKANWKNVRVYLENEDFDPEIIMNKNPAASGLCSWCIAIVKYYDTITGVEPKKKALAEAKATLEGAETKLKVVNENVAELTAKLAKLEAEFKEANETKAREEARVKKGKSKLDLAERLLAALGSEGDRWAAEIITLAENEIKLIGDTLLASAFISYIGPFTKEFRTQIINEKWIPFLQKAAGGEPIPMSDLADPVSVLATPADIAGWNSQTLPSDPVSTENGAIVCNTARWPLVIDPQLQAISWIRNMHKGITITRLDDKQLVRKLTTCIESGGEFMIENMGESIDAVLNPVIGRKYMRKGRKVLVKVGEADVEVHESFKLYLHTKLSNPDYPPEIQAETTLVNFTVTQKGLEDQLLALVVKKERLDLATKRARLIAQDNANKVKVKELGDEILRKLATAEGDVTEDIELIEGLENSKKISNDIAEQMVAAEKTQKEIAVTSEKYRSVAARGSLLFFLMNSLFKVHSYYLFSLNAFAVIFGGYSICFVLLCSAGVALPLPPIWPLIPLPTTPKRTRNGLGQRKGEEGERLWRLWRRRRARTPSQGGQEGYHDQEVQLER